MLLLNFAVAINEITLLLLDIRCISTISDDKLLAVVTVKTLMPLKMSVDFWLKNFSFKYLSIFGLVLSLVEHLKFLAVFN